MRIIHFNVVSSTQTIARKYIHNKPVLVYSDIQTKGKGRQKRKWASEYGGFYGSFILKCNKEKAPALKMAYIINTYMRKRFKITSDIYYPNDIYFKGRKMGGIITNKIYNTLIAGVGININQKGFNPELNAISLMQIIEKHTDIKNFAQDLSIYVEDMWGKNIVLEDIEQALYFPDDSVKIKLKTSIRSFNLKGLDENYNLIVSENNKYKILKPFSITRIIW